MRLSLIYVEDFGFYEEPPITTLRGIKRAASNLTAYIAKVTSNIPLPKPFNPNHREPRDNYSTQSTYRLAGKNGRNLVRG